MATVNLPALRVAWSRFRASGQHGVVAMVLVRTSSCSFGLAGTCIDNKHPMSGSKVFPAVTPSELALRAIFAEHIHSSTSRVAVARVPRQENEPSLQSGASDQGADNAAHYARRHRD
jgi:hypothetical protein